MFLSTFPQPVSPTTSPISCFLALRHLQKVKRAINFDSPLPQSLVFGVRLRCAHGPSCLEAFPAKHRAPLRWSERNRGLFSALRACGLGFCPRLRRPASSASLRSFGLARLTTLRFVLESLVGEEHLFAGRKHKLGTTLRALQDPIVVFHEPLPLDPQRAAGTGSFCTRACLCI